MNCKNCGAFFADGEAFCPNCGCPVVNSQPNPNYTQPGTNYQQTNQQPYQQPGASYQQPTTPYVQYNYQPVQSANTDPGYTLGIVSFILGIASLVTNILVVPSIVGLILGIMASKKSKEAGFKNTYATVGTVLSSVSLGLVALIVVAYIAYFVVVLGLVGVMGAVGY